MYLDQINRTAKKSAQQKAQDKERVDSGVVSALDLEAPNNAIEQYNRASTLLKAQNSKEAIKYLEKAIHDYPKFVAAHVALGQAYVDQEDSGHAKDEFEMAAKLDAKFPGSFRHLGQLALQLNDFPTAESALEKAAALTPKDVGVLTVLAYAQNGTQQYEQVLQTAQRVHTLDHKGMANVHYVAAAAAMALKDFGTMEHELNFFLAEDPTNALAPVARQNLAALAHNKEVLGAYGRALADAGNYDQALEVLERAHTPDQPDWHILSAQGAVLDQMGRHAEAQRHYETALRIAPDEPVILSNLGLSYALAKDLRRAEATLRKAATHQPIDQRVRQNLALVLGLQGRFEEAETIARADLPPNEAAANVAYLKQMLAHHKDLRDPKTASIASHD